MGKDLFEFLTAQGIFAVLFCYLLFYILKENNKREIRYQEFMFKISERVLGIEEKLDYIKKSL